MKSKIIVLFLLMFFYMIFSVLSCKDCGPFPGKYKLSEIKNNFQKYTFNSEANRYEFLEMEEDSLSFEKFAIQLFFENETFFAMNQPIAFGFSNVAYACSPPTPTTDEIVTSITVFTQVSYDDDHPAGSSLVGLFDVVVYNDATSINGERFGLSEYIATQPMVPNSLFLILKAAPTTTQEFEFSIKYQQDGVDVDSLRIETEKVKLF